MVYLQKSISKSSLLTWMKYSFMLNQSLINVFKLKKEKDLFFGQENQRYLNKDKIVQISFIAFNKTYTFFKSKWILD